MTQKSFYGFPFPTKAEWITQALRDTNLEKAEQLAYWNKVEEIKVPPIFTQEDIQGLEWLVKYDNLLSPSNSQGNESGWENVATIDLDEEAQSGIEQTLNLGIDGVILSWSGKGDLKELLAGVSPEYISIWLKPKIKQMEVLKGFLKWFEGEGLPVETLRGGFLFDPLSGLLEKVGAEETGQMLNEINKLTRKYPRFIGHCVDFGVYLDAGGNTVQQLTYGLGVMIESMDMLHKRGGRAQDFLDNFFVSAGVGGDYFFNIAKLKVLRILIGQIASLYGVKVDPGKLKVFVSTAIWNKSHLEMETNMVRNTLEAMMAVQGGANVIYVRPHDFLTGNIHLRSKRIATNVSNILKMEGHFDKVADLTAGSYYLYYLQDTIYNKVVERLKSLEEQGGWQAAFESGSIQREVRKVRERQVDEMLEGEKILVGVNAYSSGVEVETDSMWTNRIEAERQLLPVVKSLMFANRKVQKS
ncbi:hypothetical protein GCM10028791_13450 [Echinicola sediminis]